MASRPGAWEVLWKSLWGEKREKELHPEWNAREQISQLPRTKQRLVMQMLDAVIAQAGH